MEALDEVLEAWSRLDQRTQKEYAHWVEPMATALTPGEAVLGIIRVVMFEVDRYGSQKAHGGLLALTDRRLLFVTFTGMLRREMRSLEIPYPSISGINVQKAGPWMVEVSSYAGEYQFSPGGSGRAARDEAHSLGNYIRQCIDDYMTRASQPIASADPMDQLRKLAELRDAGVVTEEEFAIKKAQLLDL